MPEYRKKRVNRFKSAPRRKKKPIEAAEDIKMSPTEKRGKKTEKAEREEKNEIPQNQNSYFRCGNYCPCFNGYTHYFTRRHYGKP